ncbi:MAG: alpha/beta hydrolase [Gammaproteobacteria bacterium]|nr:alpha/beta hydrolase [Gammaproteobacteria bacterium]
MTHAHAIETRRLRGAGEMELAADVGGDPAGPAVVLLHGGGQTRHSWSAALRALVQRGYHVLNLDARGHGDSDWSRAGCYEIADLAADLRAVIATLPAPPALVGASLGAATALELIGHSSEPLARCLVLVDLVPEAEPEGVRRIHAFMSAHPQGFATLEEAADAVASYYPHRPRPRDPGGLRKNLRRRTDGRWYWHWDPAFLEHMGRDTPERFSARLAAAARGVRIPTLLVRGMQSDIVSDSGVAALRAVLPQVEVAEVAGAGHMVAGDRNDAFNAAVIGFLERHLSLPGFAL